MQSKNGCVILNTNKTQLFLMLNSSLFYVYFVAYGDCFHLSDNLASSFPVTEALMNDASLAMLSETLMVELQQHAVRKTITSRRGGTVDTIEYDEYYGARCKTTIDRIDHRLAQIYSFTPEEQDFIVNYDIKYRMGLNGTDTGDD